MDELWEVWKERANDAVETAASPAEMIYEALLWRGFPSSLIGNTVELAPDTTEVDNRFISERPSNPDDQDPWAWHDGSATPVDPSVPARIGCKSYGTSAAHRFARAAIEEPVPPPGFAGVLDRTETMEAFAARGGGASVPALWLDLPIALLVRTLPRVGVWTVQSDAREHRSPWIMCRSVYDLEWFLRVQQALEMHDREIAGIWQRVDELNGWDGCVVARLNCESPSSIVDSLHRRARVLLDDSLCEQLHRERERFIEEQLAQRR